MRFFTKEDEKKKGPHLILLRAWLVDIYYYAT